MFVSGKRRHSYVARAGHHLSPQPLSNGANVFEELGTGYTLLAFGAQDRGVEAFRRAAQSLSVPLKVVQDSYEGDRKEYESPLVLVRPDQYVAWAGDAAPRDGTGLLRKAAGIS